MYSYAAQKQHLFTEDGQVLFLKIRDRAKALCEQAGAVRMDKLMDQCSGDTWTMLAAADRLVELGEIVEVPNTTSSVGQHRLFTTT